MLKERHYNLISNEEIGPLVEDLCPNNSIGTHPLLGELEGDLPPLDLGATSTTMMMRPDTDGRLRDTMPDGRVNNTFADGRLTLTLPDDG